MKILKLIAENFKKLSAVEISPEGNVVLITGKNGAGKSSVLDGIESALCGGRSLPKQPIKTGEVRAKLEVNMGPYKVTRKFFGANSTLTVETTGETPTTVRRPQEFLDSVVGSISFDPLAFLNKQPAEQRNTLMEFLGLNLDEFNLKIQAIKAERSEVRKEKERKLHEAESITTTPNLPPQEIDSRPLIEELEVIRIHNEKSQKISTENQILQNRIESGVKEIRAAEKALVDWQNRLALLQTQQKEMKNLKQSGLCPRSPAEVEAKLKSLSATNEAIRRNNQKRAAMVDVDIHASAYKDLGDEIKVIENQKAKKLAETVMPVGGLTILSDGLGYNGLPLEQECQSKRLKICVAIAMALNPKLKVLRIEGNGLDKDSLVAIGELVAGTDYQIWIEKVSDDDSIGFYIEDGNLISGENDEKETNETLCTG